MVAECRQITAAAQVHAESASGSESAGNRRLGDCWVGVFFGKWDTSVLDSEDLRAQLGIGQDWLSCLRGEVLGVWASWELGSFNA